MSFLRENEIAIVSYAETTLSRPRPGEKVVVPEEYYAMALGQSIERIGLSHKDLQDQGLAVTGSEYPHAEIWSSEVAQNLGLAPRWLARADQGGCSALALVAEAALAIHAGIIDLAVCIGADSPILGGSTYQLQRHQFARLYEEPAGIMGPNNIFGLIARRHMDAYGTTSLQLGKIAVQQRENASRNPNAYLRKPISLDEYLDSEMISYPIRKLDCCVRVNGGLAVILARRDLARKLTDRPVFLKGFGGAFNHSFGSSNLPDITYTGFLKASRICADVSGIEPKNCSVSELYDDYTIMTLMELEDLGLCPKGDGGRLVENSDLSPRGNLPINTGGGLLSCGQPGLAGGFIPLVEAVRQLRGEAEGRQVKDATTAVVTGGGGLAYAKNLGNCMTAILSS